MNLKVEVRVWRDWVQAEEEKQNVTHNHFSYHYVYTHALLSCFISEWSKPSCRTQRTPCMYMYFHLSFWSPGGSVLHANRKPAPWSSSLVSEPSMCASL